jgi:tetratricopeptide (TPR) repeat protein
VKTIELRSLAARAVLVIVGILVLIGTWYSARRDIAAAVAYRGLDSRLPESREIADWITETSPADPYARMESARLFEKTFESDDLSRSRADYEMAAALSPDHYGLWLLLGASRDRMGDAIAAEAAYARALELAPNYASVDWAYGNSLVRHGKTTEGFAMVAKAAASDPTYANTAASVALQANDGNADAARNVLGDTPATNAALADVLASQRKFGEAYDAWSRIPPEDRQLKFKEIGQRLLTWTNEARQVRIAAAIDGDLSPAQERPQVGQISNGSFENGLKLRNAGIFEWRIGEGGEPQIGLSESVKRSGRYSLFMTFDSFQAADFRTMSQRIPVVPGATYELEGFYRADIKSKAAFKWQIVDVSDTELAATEPLALNGDWAGMHAKFTVPAAMDGIVLRFVRTGCLGGACPVSGRMSFDDFTLREIR